MNILDTGLIGLDFGSSKTVISILRKGAIEIILNECSQRETHNIVAFTEKETLVGDQAYMKLKSNYKNTILYPIRFLNPALCEESIYKNESKWQTSSIKLEKDQNDSVSLSFEVNYLGGIRKFLPAQILAFLLGFYSKKIIEHSKYVYSQYGFVLAVPAYFTQEERILLAKSAQISGLNLLKIINESAAVGLIYKKIHDEEMQNLENGKRVLFIDVGYSKIGVYLMSFVQGNITLVREIYDRYLGIRDIDNLMLEFYQGIIKKHKSEYQENFRMKLRILENIEKQRKVLSANNEAPIIVESLFDDYDLNHTLTRQDFENIISPFLDKLKALFLRFKVEGELYGKNLEIDEIEIIGGGVRIPIIQKIIIEIFNQNSLSKTLNSTECLAMGSALYCNKLAGIPINPVIANINEVLYYSIYCGVKKKGISDIAVFNKGIAYPCTTTTTIPKQDDIEYLQFYYKIDDKVYILYEINIDNEQKGIITVQSSINDNGIFILKDLKINENRLKIAYKRDLFNIITEEKLQDFIKEYHIIVKHDKLIQESYEMKNLMESYIYNRRGELLEKYQDYLSKQEHPEIKKIFEEYEHWLYNHDDSQSAKSFYEAELKELKNKIEPIYEKCQEMHENTILKTEEITSLSQFKDFINRYKQSYIDRMNISFSKQKIGNGGGLFSYFKDGMNRLKQYINQFKIQETLRLDLKNNALSDKALDYLIEILECQKDIRNLDLQIDNINGEALNEFSDKAIFRFLESLKGLNKLKSLKFAIDSIDEINFKIFIIILENMTSLEKINLKVSKGKISKESQKTFSAMKNLNKSIKSCKLECPLE